MICGVDVGHRGGIAIISCDAKGKRVVWSLTVMPEDIREFFNLMVEHSPVHIFIEKAQTMPKQGISSAFNYGRHFGELLGIIIALKIPFTMVQPREWTRVIHMGTDSNQDAKERTLQACRQLYPDVNLLATPRSKVPHEGLFDALMIAEYGLRKTLGIS